MLFVQVTPVGDGEGLVSDGVVNGAPHVDDAYAPFQETFCIRTQVTVYTSDRGIISLINVDAFLEQLNE